MALDSKRACQRGLQPVDQKICLAVALQHGHDLIVLALDLLMQLRDLAILLSELVFEEVLLRARWSCRCGLGSVLTRLHRFRAVRTRFVPDLQQRTGGEPVRMTSGVVCTWSSSLRASNSNSSSILRSREDRSTTQRKPLPVSSRLDEMSA